MVSTRSDLTIKESFSSIFVTCWSKEHFKMGVGKYRLVCDISFMAWHISKCLNLVILECVGKHGFRTCQVYPSLCWLWTTSAQPHIIFVFLSFVFFCLFVFLSFRLAVFLPFCLFVLLSLFQNPPGLNLPSVGFDRTSLILSFFSMGPLSLSGLNALWFRMSSHVGFSNCQ